MKKCRFPTKEKEGEKNVQIDWFPTRDLFIYKTPSSRFVISKNPVFRRKNVRRRLKSIGQRRAQKMRWHLIATWMNVVRANVKSPNDGTPDEQEMNSSQSSEK